MVKDLARWDPFKELLSLRDEFDRIFKEYFMRPEKIDEEWFPMLDMKEDAESIVVNIEVPGVKKDDIKVTLRGNQLIVTGERKFEKEKKDETYHRIERSYGKFQRVITIPVEVDQSKIKATYENGILSITLPKTEKEKPKEIEISLK